MNKTEQWLYVWLEFESSKRFCVTLDGGGQTLNKEAVSRTSPVADVSC